MVQFNLNRFGKLAKWTLSFDKSYYVKAFLQMLTVAALLFVLFTTRFFTFNTDLVNLLFGPCTLIYVGVLAVHLMVSPAMMFYSFRNKRDDQTYMMLPASNFEKYLARYASSLLMLFLYLGALLAGDLIQYLVNLLLGAKNHLFVLAFMIDKLPQVDILDHVSLRHVVSMLVAFFWMQSFYALGATFFRSHKYAWIFTTLVIIVGMMCISWGMLIFYPTDQIVTDETPIRTVLLTNIINLIWACVNYWLSFRCFRRSQVIDKYVNI